MASGTSIEWTEATWNPTTGCDRISPGCDNCYAMVLAKRLKAMGQPKYQNDGDPRTSGPGFGVTVHPSALSLPLDWRGSRTVFVNSMSDLSVGAKCPNSALLQVREYAFAVSRLQHASRAGCEGHLLRRCADQPVRASSSCASGRRAG
jgi:protein gp37